MGKEIYIGNLPRDGSDWATQTEPPCTIRLDAGTTKNGEGREVTMTARVFELLRAATDRKGPDDFVLTREDGKPVRDFRGAWQGMCERAGMGEWLCRGCKQPWAAPECECGSRKRQYSFIRHDMRRSAAKVLRAAGVPESIIMATGGWRTPSMLRRYAIVSSADQRAAVQMLERARAERSPNPALVAVESPTPEEAGAKAKVQ